MRTMSSRSELTPNHVPGSELVALDRLAGAADSHGQPLLFGLQPSGELVLVIHDPSVLTCWQQSTSAPRSPPVTPCTRRPLSSYGSRTGPCGWP